MKKVFNIFFVFANICISVHHTILSKVEQINIDEKNRYFKVDPFDIKEINKEMMTEPFSLFLAYKYPHNNLVCLLEDRDEIKKLSFELYDIALFKKNSWFLRRLIHHEKLANNKIVHVIRFKSGKQFFLDYKQFNEFKDIFLDSFLIQQNCNSVEKNYKNDLSN